MGQWKQRNSKGRRHNPCVHREIEELKEQFDASAGESKEVPGWCGAQVGLVGLTFVAFDFACEKLTGRIINGDHLTGMLQPL